MWLLGSAVVGVATATWFLRHFLPCNKPKNAVRAEKRRAVEPATPGSATSYASLSSASNAGAAALESDAALRAKFRFIRSDFGKIDIMPVHVNLKLDIGGADRAPNAVAATAETTFVSQAAHPISELVLHCSGQEVRFVGYVPAQAIAGIRASDGNLPDLVAALDQLVEEAVVPLAFVLDRVDGLLRISLPFALAPGHEITVRTVADLSVNDQLLEGLYLDYTPPGAPPTIISQCQQSGFQRIVPCVDMNEAKALYTTTIVASSRYTSFLSKYV